MEETAGRKPKRRLVEGDIKGRRDGRSGRRWKARHIWKIIKGGDGMSEGRWRGEKIKGKEKEEGDP